MGIEHTAPRSKHLIGVASDDYRCVRFLCEKPRHTSQRQRTPANVTISAAEVATRGAAVSQLLGVGSSESRAVLFFLHANPQDPRVKRAYERSVASYKASAALFTPPIESVEIPYEGTTIPGYFHPADSSGTPRKTLV
jgi:hypothetical protein